MNKLIITTTIATLYASTTLAGSVVNVVSAEPVVAAQAPTATDWNGFYVGGLASSASGEQLDDIDFDVDYISVTLIDDIDWENYLDGSMYGAFAGVNFQNGSIVYGVEAAYSMGSVGFSVDAFDGVIASTIVDAGEFDLQSVNELGGEFTNFIDLKARAGVAAGNALIYGFAGWSLGEYQYAVVGGSTETLAVSTSGMNYGGGVDMMVTDNFLVGLEVMVREQAANVGEGTLQIGVGPGSGPNNYTWGMSTSIQEVSLRAGWKF